MSIMDIFKAKENERLKKEIAEMKEMLSPEQRTIKELLEKIEELETNKKTLEKDLYNLGIKKEELESAITKKKEDLIILDDEILIQEFGLYKPIYDFASSDRYREKLDSIREFQKQMIKDKTAVSYFDGWTVDGSKAKGRKMTNDNIKQILRTFNTECENAIDRVKFNNIESMKKRIQKAFESLNKLNETSRISIKPKYLDLKLEELSLAYEYQVKKQEEKEEQKRIREELREEAKLQKEIEEARKNIDKDLKHFKNALNLTIQQLENEGLTDEQKQLLIQKKLELENQVESLSKKLEDIDYRQNNQKAGYVYIISNIGAFGENVYKIGMTRRLDPQDRVDELGDASVPFNFDVHAIIFTEDAPRLENALHKAFENKKLNMINQRREFFNVTLEEIEEVVKANFDKTVEFTRMPDAQQYRESLIIRGVNKN